MYCKFCGEYLGLLSLEYFCPFCSNLRRVLLLYGKENMNTILTDSLHYVDVNINDKTHDTKEEEIKKDEKKITKERRKSI
jgi:glutaredoxin